MVIVSDDSVEVESPLQAVNTYCVPVGPSTLVGEIENEPIAPLLIHRIGSGLVVPLPPLFAVSEY